MSSSNKRPRPDSDDEEDQEEEDKLMPSNTAHMEPYDGMPLEIRDSDYIWSSGYVVKVRQNGGKTMVTVASDGWGREWDELMEWPNDRLAKLYTYTKQVKCNLDLLRKKNKKPSKQELDLLPKAAKHLFSTLWPITVQFRMPHPGVKHGRDSLRLEDKVFVKPYGSQFLPDDIQLLMVHDGGCWFHHSRLRMWKDDPLTHGVLHWRYPRAFALAREDEKIKGYLIPKALEQNSLLHDIFRIHDIRGCDLLDGVLREIVPPYKKARYALVDDEDDHDDTGSGKPPSVVAIEVVDGDSKNDELRVPHYSAPPKLPPPIRIKASLYPGGGVKICEKSGEWVAFLSMSGNEVFLGSFPTESQAWIATRKASGEATVEMPKTKQEAQLMDAKAMSMATIIDAYETQYDSGVHTFSLHDWTVAKINHDCYLRDKRTLLTEGQVSRRVEPNVDNKSKRKGNPRKYDIQTHCFVR